MSPWLNNWNEVIVKTSKPNTRAEENWSIAPDLQWNFIPPLAWAEEAFRKAKAF